MPGTIALQAPPDKQIIYQDKTVRLYRINNTNGPDIMELHYTNAEGTPKSVQVSKGRSVDIAASIISINTMGAGKTATGTYDLLP
jgi:hypothetical protein